MSEENEGDAISAISVTDNAGRAGRPTKQNEETIAKLCEALADGMPIKSACAVAGIGVTDVDYSASFGVSVKAEAWHRSNDTFGLAGVVSGASRDNQKFLEAGGTDMLDGDGKLNYGWEKVLETYYDFQIWKTVHATLDYQFVTNPAFNRDRGPVSIFGARLHWQF